MTLHLSNLIKIITWEKNKHKLKKLWETCIVGCITNFLGSLLLVNHQIRIIIKGQLISYNHTESTNFQRSKFLFLNVLIFYLKENVYKIIWHERMNAEQFWK
jgi:hypothetical protein